MGAESIAMERVNIRVMEDVSGPVKVVQMVALQIVEQLAKDVPVHVLVVVKRLVLDAVLIVTVLVDIPVVVDVKELVRHNAMVAVKVLQLR